MHFEKCICAKEYFSVHHSKIPKEGEKNNLCVFIKHLFAWIYFVRGKQQGKCDIQKNNHLFSWKRLFFFLITKQSNDGFHLLIQAQGKSYVHQTLDIIWPFWYNDDLHPHSVKAPYFCNPSSAWDAELCVCIHTLGTVPVRREGIQRVYEKSSEEFPCPLLVCVPWELQHENQGLCHLWLLSSMFSMDFPLSQSWQQLGYMRPVQPQLLTSLQGHILQRANASTRYSLLCSVCKPVKHGSPRLGPQPAMLLVLLLWPACLHRSHLTLLISSWKQILIPA